MSAIRRMMMGARKSGYVTDGLVFRLDGIDKGTTDTSKWVDLVGGVVFTNDGAVRGDTYWQFDNNNTSYALKNTDNLSYPSETCTIEAVFDSTKTSGLIFVPKESNMIALGCLNTLIIRNTQPPARTGWLVSVFTGKHAISVNSSVGMQDFATLQSGSANYWSSGNYNGIGARSVNNAYSFNGKIYAIRIYNRLLTANEMLQNQRYDNERFNLGLTI